MPSVIYMLLITHEYDSHGPLVYQLMDTRADLSRPSHRAKKLSPRWDSYVLLTMAAQGPS